MLGLGFLVGILLAIGQVYGNWLIRFGVSTVERFFRAIPALVLLFLFYFGSSYFGISLSAFISTVLALGFRSAAYQSQIFRGAIQAIGEGQFLAARSIGMSRIKAIIHIIIPQALRLSIPSWSNEYAIVLKDTSLAYAIGVTEMLRQGRYIVVRSPQLGAYGPIMIYIVVALIYLVLTQVGVKILDILEEKFRIPGYEVKGERRRESV